MATKEIIQLPAGTYDSTLQVAVQLSAGGLGSTQKLPITDILNSVPTSNVVYANSLTGDDSGSGNILSPFLTLTHALASITTASSSNPFFIKMSGFFTETDVAFKPFIYILGQNSTLNVTGSVTLDSSFSTVGSLYLIDLITNFSNGINFDLSSYSNTSMMILTNLFIQASASWIIKGSLTQGSILVMDGVFGDNAEINLQISDCYGAVEAEAVQNFQFSATSPTLTTNFGLHGVEVLGDALITAASGCTVDFNVQEGLINGTLTTQDSGGGTVGFLNKNCLMLNSPIIDGTGVSFITTTLQAMPTFTGGATSAQVDYLDKADSIGVQFTPVNYSPVDSQVEGHLEGIDNALGSSATPQIVYYSPNGNDTTGNGSFLNPFATASHSISTITTSSAATPFIVHQLGGVVTETNPVNMKAYTTLSGEGQGTTLVINGGFGIDNASLTANPNAFFYIQDITLDGETIFDLSSATGLENPNVFLFNMQTTNTVEFNNGTPEIDFTGITYFVLYSQLADSAANACTVISQCSTLPTINPGSTTDSIPASWTSYNDTIFNIVATGAPDLSSGAFVNVYNCSNLIGANISNDAHLKIDSGSLGGVVPALSTSGTYSLITKSYSIEAPYSPTNYSPVTTTVDGNLKGIDNKFGTILAYTPDSVTFTISGAIASQNWTILLYKIGNIVFMRYIFFSATITTPSTTITSSAGAVPSDYRPTTQSVNMPISIVNGLAAVAPGMISISTAGTITITDQNGAGFAATGSAGVNAGCITYTTD